MVSIKQWLEAGSQSAANITAAMIFHKRINKPNTLWASGIQC